MKLFRTHEEALKEIREYYAFCKSKNICVRCHQADARINRVTCDDCAKKMNERYAFYKAKNICVYCKRAEAKRNKNACGDCAKKINVKQNNRRRERRMNL